MEDYHVSDFLLILESCETDKKFGAVYAPKMADQSNHRDGTARPALLDFRRTVRWVH
jgi:hypothetical protein